MFVRATKEGAIIVDADNAHLIADCTVSVVKGTYSTHVETHFGGQRARLSRLVITASEDAVVDHINGNPLDNRRENLRCCTVSQNNWNRRRRKGGTSKYKGVSLNCGRWRATISPRGRNIYLGTYATEVEAARAYDAAAREHYGEFACVNFPVTECRTAILHANTNTDLGA